MPAKSWNRCASFAANSFASPTASADSRSRCRYCSTARRIIQPISAEPMLRTKGIRSIAVATQSRRGWIGKCASMSRNRDTRTISARIAISHSSPLRCPPISTPNKARMGRAMLAPIDRPPEPTFTSVTIANRITMSSTPARSGEPPRSSQASTATTQARPAAKIAAVATVPNRNSLAPVMPVTTISNRPKARASSVRNRCSVSRILVSISFAQVQGAIVSSLTSHPASMPPGSIWPRSSPTSASSSRFIFSFIASSSSGFERARLLVSVGSVEVS